MSNKYKIQTIVFPKETKHMMCRDLFYHGENGYLDRENGILTLGTGQKCDFNTYINSCSWAKWRLYTNVKKISLILDIEGSYELRYIGYSMEFRELVRNEFDVIKKEKAERNEIIFEYPENNETILGVEITAIDKCVIYGGYYEAEYEGDLNDVHLSIATTTCKKEEFIKKNVKLIKDEILNGDDEIKDNLTVHVVDNGRTLDEKDIVGNHVFLHPNPNVGGSGGFARGMLESLHQHEEKCHEKPSTHVLLMDDDVLVLPESIKRTYHLLRMLKEEYKEHFISGAMLRYEKPMMQHEDIGTVEGGGIFIPYKPSGDLSDLHNVVKNEGAYFNAKNKYAAWWYCCIPISQIKLHGLPLPLFIRCDDSEYSLRCNAKILTLNAICIWHMGFEMKYNPAMDVYMQNRNMHIAKATSEIMRDLDIHGDYIQEFYRKLYKFEYGACDLMLDGFEDYLKGPDFIKKCDGERIINEKRKKNEKLSTLSEFKDVRIQLIEAVFWDEPRKFLDKLFFHVTVNGHRFTPDFMYKKNQNRPVVAYGGSIQTQKITRVKEYIAVDPYSESCVERKIDKKRGKALLKRLHTVEKNYRKMNKSVERLYREQKKELTSEEFWREKLGI